MGDGWWFWLVGSIGTVVLLALITVGVIYLVKRAKAKRGGVPGGPVHPGAMFGGHGRAPAGPNALFLLDQRLATGEIEVEDYLTRRSALLGEGGPAHNEWLPRPGAAAPGFGTSDESGKPAGTDGESG
jgi:hypothetical protein